MRQWTVDAFASAPFMGNPACVLAPLDAWPEDAWMQRLAQENNQAETAFLRRTADPSVFDLRWFTPGVEVPLCGHATLASAHVLTTELGVTAPALRFHTKSGELVVSPKGGAYEMNFPANPSKPVATPAGLVEALGADVLETWSAAYLVAVVADEATVRGLDPNIAALHEVSKTLGGRGDVIVAAAADAERPYQLVSRFFAPGAGVAEDPATGSAHCILAPLFADKFERASFDCFQAFPGRGGEIGVAVQGDRVILSGRAVTVAETQLRL